MTKPLAGPDTSAVPANPLPPTPLHPPDATRIVDLQELQDVYDLLDLTQAPSLIPRHELRLDGLRLGRKDTVRVPPGGYVRIRAFFDRPGEYMWHCHILAHEDHAMMRPFEVVP